MARARALAARRQVDLQFAKLGRLAQVVVADEAIEVEGSGGARVNLDRRDFRQFPGDVARREEHAFSVLQTRPFGQVGDDCDLRLVVERQQFYRDALRVEQAIVSSVATPTDTRNSQADRFVRMIGAAVRR